MDNKEVAKQVVKAFNHLLDDTTLKARNGSDKAAISVMKEITAMNLVLKFLGYMTNDNGKLVKYKVSTDPLISLAIQARKGDVVAAVELLKLMKQKQ